MLRHRDFIMQEMMHLGNAYKTASSSENLYFYKEVTLPDGAFNSWQTEAFVSNRYDPPITVDPDGSTASEKTDLAVSKNWENDTESDRPESITVHLYANGADTGKTLTLNKANNWSDSFEELDVYQAGKKISYSVKEDVPEGYSVKYQYSNTDSTANTGNDDSEQKGYWVRTDKLVDGETYLIVTSPGTGNVTGMEIKSGGGGFSWTPGNGAGTIKVDGPITINGQTYGTHITQEEAAQHKRMQWTAHAKGAYAANQVGYHNWFYWKVCRIPAVIRNLTVREIYRTERHTRAFCIMDCSGKPEKGRMDMLHWMRMERNRKEHRQ